MFSFIKLFIDCLLKPIYADSGQESAITLHRKKSVRHLRIIPNYSNKKILKLTNVSVTISNGLLVLHLLNSTKLNQEEDKYG